MFITAKFSENLINSIIGFMNENNVSKLPLRFLASGEYGFPETSAIAKRFIDTAHWEYLFVDNGKLYLNVNYHGEYHLGEYNYEVTPIPLPYSDKHDDYHIMTFDLVNLIRIAYDTIGNVNFNKHKNEY